MIPVRESINRLRILISDRINYEDGQPRPDIKYSDDSILIELRSALRKLLAEDSQAFFPDVIEAEDTIDNLTVEGTIPLQGRFVKRVEDTAFKALETRDQEGTRSEVVQNFEAGVETN